MITNPWPGKFVVFEGIDYCGKGTQLSRLEKYLLAYTNASLLMTNEPTEEYYGKIIRKILATPSLFSSISAASIQSLYAVDSREHMERKVVPALKDDKLVVSDRYRISSVAYGAENLMELAQYLLLNETVLGESFLWPDLIVYIDITAEEAIERKKKARREVEEGFEQYEKLRKVRSNYLHMAESADFPNFCVVDGCGQEEEIFLKIKSAVMDVANIKEA